MTRERKAQIATVAILAAALVLVGARRGGWKPSSVMQSTLPATPQDTVYRMMDAARDGDVKKYIECYTGAMQSSLRQVVTEKGEAALADYIRGFNSVVKGVAIQEPQTMADGRICLRADFVYSDRNETQVLYLTQAGGWKIEKQETAQGTNTVVRYGTPVE